MRIFQSLLLSLALLLFGSVSALGQGNYWQMGWNSISGHRLPYVGHYAYNYFVKGEQEGEEGCARVVVAGLTLLDPTPGRNKSEIVRLINKWYKQDEKISLMAASYYLPKDAFNPGQIILSWHNGTPERYTYVPGQQPNLKQSLFYAKYAYEKLNSGDGDSERFYKSLLAYCYDKGAGGYSKDELRAAKLGIEVEDYSYLEALIRAENSQAGLYSLMNDCVSSTSWTYGYSGYGSSWETTFINRRNLLKDRFLNLSTDKMAAEWATLPSDVKSFLNREARQMISKETDFGVVSSLLNRWPDKSLGQTVGKSLTTDYVDKANRLLSSSTPKAKDIQEIRAFAKSIGASGLVPLDQFNSTEASVKQLFLNDLNTRSRKAFEGSSLNKTAVQDLFSYANALVQNNYATESALSPISTELSSFCDRMVRNLHNTSSASLGSASEQVRSAVSFLKTVVPSWLTSQIALARAESAARQGIDLVAARRAGISDGYKKFLESHPDAYPAYREEAEREFGTLLAQEQDEAAFNAAFSLTKKPSASEKRAILSMPMSPEMATIIPPMLTGNYIRQHNKASDEPQFKEWTMTHSDNIDWSTGGPFYISFGGLIGVPLEDYVAYGFYGSLSYNFKLSSLSGLRTGAGFIYEKGALFVGDEVEREDAFLRKSVFVPLYFTLGAEGKPAGKGAFQLYLGPSFHYTLGAEGYYGDMYYDDLLSQTTLLKPYNIRGDIGVSVGYSHLLLDGGISLGFADDVSFNKYDWRLHLGLSLIF